MAGSIFQRFFPPRTLAEVAGWPSAREIFRATFRLPPEVQVAALFMRELRENGEEAAWRAFEAETGITPDALLKARVRSSLADCERVIIPLLARFLEEHRNRLRRKHESAVLPTALVQGRRSIRRYPSLEASLAALSLAGQSHDLALRELLPGAMYVEEADNPSGSNVAGRAASAIRREGLERPDQPDLVVPLTLDVPDDLTELTAFLIREDLRHDAAKASLSRQEHQVFELVLAGHDNAEVATMLDRSYNQVRQVKRRAFQKLRQHRQVSGV